MKKKPSTLIGQNYFVSVKNIASLNLTEKIIVKIK